jgi:hypothetical protein
MCARTAKKVPHLPVLEEGFLFADQEVKRGDFL